MSNIDRYTQFIAEQVRKGHVAGLRANNINEATEKTAIKHELKNLNHHIGGSVEGPQRTGRGSQMTMPKIDTSHLGKEKVAKALVTAGYKKTGHQPGTNLFPHDSHDSYEKVDQHGFKHYVNHAFNTRGGGFKHSVHHVGASKQ